MKKLSFQIAWRYVWAKKSMNVVHIIMWASIVSVIVAVASLTVILSIYNGMAESTYKQFRMVCPDLLLKSGEGLRRFEVDSSALQIIEKETEVYSEVVEQEALVSYQNKRILVRLVGVDDDFSEVAKLQEYTTKQIWNVGSEESPLLVVSSRAAHQLLINPDEIKEPLVISTIRQGELISKNLLSELSTRTAHTFTTYYELAQDLNNLPVIYTHIDFVKQLTENNTLSALYIKLGKKDKSQTEERLKRLLPQYKIQNRFEQNETYFTIFSAEKKMLMVVIFFMLVISMSGSIGMLRILFLEKIRHAKVLFFLGYTFVQIQSIFLYQSIIIHILGLGIGLLLGGGVLLTQFLFSWLRIEGSTYSIPYEVIISFSDMLYVVIGVACLCGLGIIIAMRGVKKKIMQGLVEGRD